MGNEKALTQRLEDVRISVPRRRSPRNEKGGGGGGGDFDFTLCFWVYISGLLPEQEPSPETVLLHQLNGDNAVPFLSLDKNRKFTIYPLMYPHKGDPIFSRTEGACVTSESVYLLQNWVHVAYEVISNHVRLYIDGTVSGEMFFSCLSSSSSHQSNLDYITFTGNDGRDENLKCYIHHLKVLSNSISIMDHFGENPPIQLSVDASCTSDGIEESDGVWKIAGGKASCRRNFSLDVVLLDALGHPADKDIWLFASLVYADNGTLVEKTQNKAVAPLLANCDGIEYPSTSRPVELKHGRASLKLKISQLSSKCCDRLFRVHIQSTNAEMYYFLEAYSPPIHCVSRIRTVRMSNSLGRRSTAAVDLYDESNSEKNSEDSAEVLHDYEGNDMQTFNMSDSTCYQSPKHLKKDHDNARCKVAVNGTFQESRSVILKSQEDCCLAAKILDERNGHEGSVGDNRDMASDSESSDIKLCKIQQKEDTNASISDEAVFRYCIEDTDKRAILLSEIAVSADEHDMIDFAEKVSLFTECSHHRYQILMTKQLLQEGDELWHTISQNKNCVLWADGISEIVQKFLKISHACRSLSGEDIEILQRIAGCGEEMNRVSFDKMWSWLYPVAFALSNEQIHKMWECTSPKWIEGLITKEEAENSLSGSMGVQKPGTFVIRFPTSRSWPHPDAGSLAVTYVGPDLVLHNKLLHLHSRNMDQRPLQDRLLEEPELSQLGRVMR